MGPALPFIRAANTRFVHPLPRARERERSVRARWWWRLETRLARGSLCLTRIWCVCWKSSIKLKSQDGQSQRCVDRIDRSGHVCGFTSRNQVVLDVCACRETALRLAQWWRTGSRRRRRRTRTFERDARPAAAQIERASLAASQLKKNATSKRDARVVAWRVVVSRCTAACYQ